MIVSEGVRVTPAAHAPEFRRRALDLVPEAVVLGAVRSRSLKRVVRELDAKLDSLALGLSVVIAPEGIEIWSGWTDIRRDVQLPWSDVSEVSVEIFDELGRSSRGTRH